MHRRAESTGGSFMPRASSMPGGTTNSGEQHSRGGTAPPGRAACPGKLHPQGGTACPGAAICPRKQHYSAGHSMSKGSSMSGEQHAQGESACPGGAACPGKQQAWGERGQHERAIFSLSSISFHGVL